MVDATDRLDKVEARLGAVETAVGELRLEVGGLRGEVGALRGEVGELRGEVGGLRGEVGGLRGEVGGLSNEVGALRALGEANANDIKLIAEVQTHHGRQLEEITKALEPLAEIHDFVRLVAGDHERRITALERNEGRR